VNAHISLDTKFIDLGLIDYKEAWDYQTSLFERILDVKKANRNSTTDAQQLTENFLIFCEHPHVYTLGKSGNEQNLLVSKEDLHKINAAYYHINRGGDITYHGPGQLVGYPILDLENFFTDIHRYLRLMEEAVIQTLSHYQLVGGRINGLTGVWIDAENPDKARKICALGVKTSRWVTMHGLAFNVNTNLDYFKHIVPCGIQDKAVTSLQHELGREVSMREIKEVMQNKLKELFHFQWKEN
jgi:lipoyl(octanoyl) transferase